MFDKYTFTRLDTGVSVSWILPCIMPASAITQACIQWLTMTSNQRPWQTLLRIERYSVEDGQPELILCYRTPPIVD